MNTPNWLSQFKTAASTPKHAPLTPFEQALFATFDVYKGMRQYTYLCVGVYMDPEGQHSFIDPVLRKPVPGFYEFHAVEHNENPADVIEVMNGWGRPVVMALDLHKPIADQIPDWKPGTIKFPGQYVAAPILHIPEPKVKTVSEAVQAFARHHLKRPPPTPQ